MVKNKKGIATIEVIYFVTILFVFLLFIGIFSYAFNVVTIELSRDVMVGAVNLSNATGGTLGQINTALLDKLDLAGMMVIFGMVLGMFANAYFTRNRYPKVFFILDIIILLITYVVSVYISNFYETIIQTAPFQTIFQTNLANPSTFMLNLPGYSVVIGIIIMIISYSNIPTSPREGVFVGESP